MVHVLDGELVLLLGGRNLDVAQTFQFLLQGLFFINFFWSIQGFVFFNVFSLVLNLRFVNLLQDQVPLVIEGEVFFVTRILFLRQGGDPRLEKVLGFLAQGLTRGGQSGQCLAESLRALELGCLVENFHKDTKPEAFLAEIFAFGSLLRLVFGLFAFFLLFFADFVVV